MQVCVVYYLNQNFVFQDQFFLKEKDIQEDILEELVMKALIHIKMEL